MIQARAQHCFPRPSSERVSTFSAPPRPWSSNECHMLGGTFPENKIPQTRLTARCRKDCVNREDSGHVRQRDPCGRGTRPRMDRLSSSPSPRTGRQTLGPRRPQPGHLPSLSSCPSARLHPHPPSPGLLGPWPQLWERWLCVALVLHVNHKGQLKSGRVLSHNVVFCSTERFRKCPRPSL